MKSLNDIDKMLYMEDLIKLQADQILLQSRIINNLESDVDRLRSAIQKHSVNVMPILVSRSRKE